MDADIAGPLSGFDFTDQRMSRVTLDKHEEQSALAIKSSCPPVAGLCQAMVFITIIPMRAQTSCNSNDQADGTEYSKPQHCLDCRRGIPPNIAKNHGTVLYERIPPIDCSTQIFPNPTSVWTETWNSSVRPMDMRTIAIEKPCSFPTGQRQYAMMFERRRHLTGLQQSMDKSVQYDIYLRSLVGSVLQYDWGEGISTIEDRFGGFWKVFSRFSVMYSANRLKCLLYRPHE